MKKIYALILSLALAILISGCEKTVSLKQIEETPDRDFEVTDDMLMVVVTRADDSSIHDFYVYEDDVEITFSKIECHNEYDWIERTEDVTNKYFKTTTFNKGDKGTFACEASYDGDVMPKYVLDARSKKDGSYNYWLSTLYHGYYTQEALENKLDVVDYLIKGTEDSYEEEFLCRMYSIKNAVAISRYLFGDEWGLAETGGAAAGGDIQTDGRLYWKAVAWGIYETGDAIFLDEKGKEIDKFEEPYSIRSLVVDGDTLEDVRRAMFQLRFWPEDIEGAITKLSKDRYELAFDPIYLDYYAIELNSYFEKENEAKYDYEVGLEANEETQERFPESYVILNLRFDTDNECNDFYEFYKNKRFPFTVVETELSESVG